MYFEQNEEKCIGQAVLLSCRNIDTTTVDNAISHTKQHRKQTQIVSMENVLFTTPYQRSIYTIAPRKELNLLREQYSAFHVEKDNAYQGKRNVVVLSESKTSFPVKNKTC
jgi:hypothetical protein